MILYFELLDRELLKFNGLPWSLNCNDYLSSNSTAQLQLIIVDPAGILEY